MDFKYCKTSVYARMLVLLSACLLAGGAPLAMLQHATSSQSIVFHQPQPTTPTAGLASSSPIEQYGGGSHHHQPKYEYKYEVSDHQTGDRKSHWESREGDTVRGVYTLYEPDGALRTVEYTADSLHGFNAVVRRDEPTSHLHRRPQDKYNHGASSNSVHDGYDASASNSRYSSESERGFQNSNQGGDYSRRSGSNAYIPGVGYSVNHLASLRKPGENSVKPY